MGVMCECQKQVMAKGNRQQASVGQEVSGIAIAQTRRVVDGALVA